MIRGTDFTDLMTVAFVQTPAPAITCTALEPDALSCSVPYPAGGSGMPERVGVTVTQRPEAGGTTTAASAFTWTAANNETGVAEECDYCNLQFPAAITVAAGANTGDIFGQIYEVGRTDVTSGGPAPGILAEVGYGAAGSDPRMVNWTWFAAAFNVEAGFGNNNDEFRGSFSVPTAGSYNYTYRYSLDGGLTWTYADLDGSGSNAGNNFSPAATGILTVN